MIKFKKKVAIFALCATVFASGVNALPWQNGMTVWATEAGSGSSGGSANTATTKVTLKDAIKDAQKVLEDHYKTVIIGMDDEKKAKAKELYKQYKEVIAKLKSVNSVEDSLQTAKDALSALNNAESGNEETGDGADKTTPTSSSDFIMVGGNWITPTARYGQYVNVVLPVVNMMQGVNLNNVVVTPVVATSTSEWPFEIETSGYNQTIADLPGAGNGQNDMDRRRELTWTFKTKSDVLNGYYKVPFLLNYVDPVSGEAVQVTLTTYVLAVGAPGSGNVAGEDAGKYSTPRVIVTGYETNPKEVYAGDTFTLTLHLKNTSVNTSVSNMLVNISAPTEGMDTENTYSAFMPSSGSNTFYVDKITKGGTKDLSIEMTAKSDLSQKPYSLDIAMEYEDENINAYTSNSDISIQVRQDARFELSKPEIMPAEIMVGDQANVMFSIYNTGQVTLYNVKVSVKGDSVECDETYLGKVESGATGSVDTMVTGASATTDDGTVKIVMTYEDENGETSTYEEDMTLIVSEMDMSGMGMEMEGMEYGGMEYEEEVTGFPVWAIVLIVVVVIVVIVVVIILILKKKRKKKEENELLELLEDTDDLDAEEDSSFTEEESVYEETAESETAEEEAVEEELEKEEPLTETEKEGDENEIS